ncbi:MAG TPA: hypothetical protein VNW94_10520 [Streptosporangiaceae bacterium]|nr:hypothetical protein [Streptosporangiaceae bacterium]
MADLEERVAALEAGKEPLLLTVRTIWKDIDQLDGKTDEHRAETKEHRSETKAQHGASIKMLQACRDDIQGQTAELKRLNGWYEILALSGETTKRTGHATSASLSRLNADFIEHTIAFDAFKNDMTSFKDEMVTFKDDMTTFKDEMVEFKDDMTTFKDEMVTFKDETRERFDAVMASLAQINTKLDYRN